MAKKKKPIVAKETYDLYVVEPPKQGDLKGLMEWVAARSNTAILIEQIKDAELQAKLWVLFNSGKLIVTTAKKNIRRPHSFAELMHRIDIKNPDTIMGIVLPFENPKWRKSREE